MKKNKLGHILTYSAIFCAVGVVAGNGFSNILSAEVGPSTWKHYLGVAPTYRTAGCKEYWVQCGTNLISLEEPTGGNIEEGGTPDQTLINSFKSYSDDRYISQITEYELGSYPQTVVTDPEIITALHDVSPSLDGFLHYDGEKYAFLYATPCYSGAKFANGDPILSDTEYYFKVEPIEWVIYSTTATTLSLTTKKVIDNVPFDSRTDSGTQSMTARNNYNGVDETTSTADVYSNNYKYSEVRKWLNEIFIYGSGIPSSDILAEKVDNSPNSTDKSVNPYCCEDTYDKIYLLCYRDYKYSSFYTSNSKGRQSTPTDYAKARGSAIEGSHWQRSPMYNAGFAYYISSTGEYGGGQNTYFSACGVCPGLKINMPNN